MTFSGTLLDEYHPLVYFRDQKKPLSTRVWLAFPRAASAMITFPRAASAMMTTEQHRLRLARYNCSSGVWWRRAAGGEQRAAISRTSLGEVETYTHSANYRDIHTLRKL